MIVSFRRVAGCGPGSGFFLCKPEIETEQGIYPEPGNIIFLN